METNLNYLVKDLLVMQYVPRLMRFHNKKRSTSAFLYIIEGEYHYKTKQGNLTATSGDAVYLPIDSNYSYEITSTNTSCIYTEFIMEAQKDDKSHTVQIYPQPFVIKNRRAELRSLFRNLAADFIADRLSALGNLYHILSILEQECAPKENNVYLGKIAPAIRYVQQNYTKKIYTDELASMCNLSPAHMRRLFIEKIGLSPIKYKNYLTMQAACAMLKAGSLNISEVANALNFPDIYAFSQAFKKEIGISPKQYTSNIKTPR